MITEAVRSEPPTGVMQIESPILNPTNHNTHYTNTHSLPFELPYSHLSSCFLCCFRILRGANATLGSTRLADMGNTLCQTAAEGNVQHLERLYNCGVDINKVDYDGRSALNVAAGEGHASTVEWLLKHGAKVNTTDRFGNTPLGDASRSRSKQKHVVMQLLITHGAQLESSEWEIRYDPLLTGSILRSLSYILQRGHAVYIEAWLPNEDEREFQLLESSLATKEKASASLATFTSAPADSTYTNSTSNLMGKAWSTKQPVVFNDITEKDMPSRYKQAKEAGLRSGVILPVMYNDKPFAVLKLFTGDNTARANKEELVELMHFAGGIVTAGMYRKGKMPSFSHAPPHLPRQQMVEVYAMICQVRRCSTPT